MSIRVMSAVWDNGPEDQGELLVLLALADYADDNGYCWPAMPSVAAKARMSERNARRIIRKLEASGLLLVEENRGRNATNRYRVIAPERKPDTVSGFEKTGHLRPENRTFEARKPDICDTKPDTAMSDEPSITVKEPSRNRQGDFDAFWDEVPRKVGKDAARKAYASALKRADSQTILEGIRRYAQERAGEDEKFTAHPASWLNAGRWADAPAKRPNDFHKQMEDIFNGFAIRDARSDDSAGAEYLPAPVQDAGPLRPGDGPTAHPNDGGRYQQEIASLIAPRRFGGSLV